MSLSPPLQMAITPRPRQDFALDNNDAIIKRLNDIVLSIAGDTRSSLDSNTIAAINSELDNIELLLGREEKRTEFGDRAESDLESQKSMNVGDDGLHTPLTPIQEPQISIEPSLQVFSPPPRPAANITASWAMNISKAADELTSKLITSVQELQKRREESEHIRGLLVARAEKAAERIIYLESEISEMEDDFEASQSELRYLRIQLQALEAQCSQYMPYEEDKELSQSIMNWKVDWEDIDRRSKARRLKRSALLANVHASRTGL